LVQNHRTSYVSLGRCIKASYPELLWSSSAPTYPLAVDKQHNHLRKQT